MSTDPPVELLDERYEVGPVIGRGAMGEVRRGRDLRLGRDVAIKYLRADLAADADVRSRFEDEARAAAQLSHPAIVTVFDSGENDHGVPYLVMECLPGTTLAGELANGPIPTVRAAGIASAIAGALAVAHEVGVVHRDVKPGNILLTDTGQVKLADFGIAKSTDGVDLTATGMIVGTPAYLAPERLAGEPATAGSDVYSLGVVLYEALTGTKPFRGDTPVALAHAIHTTTPTPVAELLPDVDPALATAIDRAMAKDPATRPASGREFEAALTSGSAPTVALPTAPGDATVAMAADPTRAMPTAPATDTLAPDPRSAMPPMAGWWHGRRSGERRALAVAVGVLIVLGVVWMASGNDGGIDPPSTTTTVATVVTGEGTSGPELPPALDGAIAQLEEAVQP